MHTNMTASGKVNQLATWLLLSLIVAACSGANTQSAVDTAIAQTQQISELQTAAAGAVAYATPQSEDGLPQATQPPTPVPTQPAWNWNGIWTMWWGNNTYVVTITQSGNQISGSFGEGVQMIVIEGTLSNGGQNASGTWTFPLGEGDGNFEWQLKAGNPNQFVGNKQFRRWSLVWCKVRRF
ncbi:MAG: hypothetical protein ACRDFQ_06340 [Anaerolineales bacterium]